MPNVILAFSGGLDTTFCIPYLQEKGYDVITVTVNTGGFTEEELEVISEKSQLFGAIQHIKVDAEKELYEQFVTKIIQSNYLRGGGYPACVGPERLVAAEAIAKVATREGVFVIAHGSTGAGNDQVRFDLALRAMIPNIEILAPIRDEELTREQEVDYLKTKGFAVSAETKDYSVNVGVLGTTVGGKETHSTLGLPPDEIYPSVPSLENTPDDYEAVKIGFEKGLPVALNDQSLPGIALIKELRTLAQKHGIGKGSHLGSTILGIKGRIVFEASAMKVLIAAHQELEKSVLTSKQVFWKNHLGTVWGDMVHEGLYFDPVVQDIEAMIESSQRTVTGEVHLKFYKGNVITVGSQSPFSLLDKSVANYGEENKLWDARDAAGFCKLYGLEGIIAHQKHKNL